MTTTANKNAHRTSLRTPALAAGAATLALVLSACGNSDAPSAGGAPSGEITGTITLQTWALTPKFTDYLNGVIADFQKANPGAKVTLQDQPGDGYADKVLSQAASNSLPDVINLPPDIALPLAKRGILLDLAKGDDTLASTYVNGALDAYTYRGVDGTFGYPWYLNTDVDYWNAAIFSKCGLDPKNPPKTTDELFAQAKILHDKCPNDYLMSTKPGLSDFTLAGVKIVSDDGTKFVFAEDPKAAALIGTYRDAYKAGYMPPSVLNTDYLGNSKLFTQGKVAWTTGGGNSLSDFIKDNPSLKGNVVVSPALNIAPLYIQGISVSSQSKHPATAVAFAKFLTNAKNQEAFAHLVNIFPSTLSSQSDPYFSTDDGTENGQARVLANNSLKTAKLLAPVEANSAMTDFLGQQIALAMKGDTTPEQALKTAQDRMNTLLSNG